jgi:NADPH:quinone reductase
MNAVFVDPGNGRLYARKVPTPRPAIGEVLVKMAAAPVNPSDLARIRELSPEEAVEFVPGVEGCGTVVEAGKGILPSLFLGKRVACSSRYSARGTWAEYMVTPAGSCFPIGRGISDEQASMALVNPMTALALCDIAKSQGHRAVVVTAAASALGKMLSSFLEKNGIKVLQIVRNEEGVKKLRERNAKFVLNSSSAGFLSEFRDWCHSNHATLMLDAVGGELVNPLLPLMPKGSVILIYGNLSQQPVEFMPPLLVRESKTVTGFFLGYWIGKQGMLKNIRNLMKVRKLLHRGMETHVQAIFPLQEAQKAVELYESGMGKGKVLLKM